MQKNNQNIKIKTNLSSLIFTKKTNTDYKLVPFNPLVNNIGKIKYLPPVSKEWKNTVYNYNSKNIIQLPVYDLNINELIKGYFNLYFNHKFLGQKYISRKRKRRSFNRIFVSKAEIKHTNEKAIITLYVYNKERLALLKKIQKLNDIFLNKKMKNIVQKSLNVFSNIFKPLNIKPDLNNIVLLWSSLVKEQDRIFWRERIFSFVPFSKEAWETLRNSLTRRIRFTKKATKIFTIIRRLKLKLSLNKYKFEEQFLFKLSSLISKYYNKKVEFNIVNLQSIAYNTDIFTEVLTLKLKKDRSNPVFRINSLFGRIPLSKVNTIIERGKIKKQVDFELVENKYKYINLKYITELDKQNKTFSPYKDNLNKLLYNLYYKTIIDNSNLKSQSLDSTLSSLGLNKAYYLKLRDIIFENIKYKGMGGARFFVKGRLTRRYRADRAIYKVKSKGGMKNIDSSFKGLSTVTFRGYLDSNLEKSMLISKRRIGSFAVKGWFSGK